MAQHHRPFSIKIFLPEGIPEGLRLIEKSNWTGLGILCPRALFTEAKKRKEFLSPGVYVLEGPSEEGELPTIYIGEGDPVKARLESHYAKKDFWTRVIFFVSKDGSLNKAHIQYLESRLIVLAKEAKRARLDNEVGSSPPSLNEADQADVDSFLDDMLSIYPLLGITAFEKPKKPTKKETHLFLKNNIKKVCSTGAETADGFVVFKGSEMVTEESEACPDYATRIRRDLIDKGVVERKGEVYVFTQDYSFSSPSSAGGVIQGRSTNGRECWKNSKGVTLKEIQETKALEQG
jgi:Domain of unknown function (DUF4357)